MAPHSSTVARKIPWMEEPGRLQSMGSLRVGHDWATSLSLSTFMHWKRKCSTFTFKRLFSSSSLSAISVVSSAYLRLLIFLNEVTAAKSLQSCPTLCEPIDGSPRGSPIPGALQARTLEWVAISFSNAWKWKVKVKSLSLVQLLSTPWTLAHQAPPSMGFSRQECWNGVPLPSPQWG